MSKLFVSSSPHIKSDHSTSSVMFDVIIALSPLIITSVFFFSFRALIIITISVVSCVLFEYLYCLLMKIPSSVGDLSAVVTGILLALNLPVTVPVWLPIIGAAFAIIVVKMLFGGIGKNVVNPALAGRILLFVSFSKMMTNWALPIGKSGSNTSLMSLFGSTSDIVTGATPLSFLKNADGQISMISNNFSISDCFVGTIGGCLGETSALLIILGGIYLLIRGVITWRIPVCYITTVALITLILPHATGISAFSYMAYNLFSGGLMLGAIFMATDYSTSPITPKGQIIYGIGCGLLTVFIRYFGGYPEGVSFAIFLMNFFVWFIDKKTMPKKFGGVKHEEEAI